ncbi:MAG: DUF4012 domain-containing protein [Candidatus Paceibacterota bacterium]
MDIKSPQKSRLLYQTGDKKTCGVVDLRCFAKSQKPATIISTGKTFYEVKSTRRSNNISQKSFSQSNQQLKTNASSIMVNNNPEKELTSANVKRQDEESPKTETVKIPEAERPFESPIEEKAKNKNRILDESLLSSKFSFSSSFLPKNLKLPTLPRFSLSTTRLKNPRAYLNKSFARFTVSSFMIPIIIFTFSFTQSQFEQKGKVLGESITAYGNLKSATQYALASDFTSTSENFDSATMNFSQARETVNQLGFGIGEVIAGLPIDTPLSTAQNLTAAGENISLTGKDVSEILEKISEQDRSGLENFIGLEKNLQNISEHLNATNENLQKVDTQYIPADMLEKINLAKETLPTISKNFQKLAEDYPLIIKMLGAGQSQKYLLLFENNSEMRATGGFIGSYGILDIENGKIKNLMIDGIFNPDGQLQEKIVPPMPIQKISASWSMHDSNWFADFPTSAKKTALLYEKTGGPTVNGVIAITPETIKKLLEITGPIEMPDYGVTITAENFVAETQEQVESLYDKKKNEPKKILSDLAPILIERLFQDDTETKEMKAEKTLGIIQKIEESLKEKHIIIYNRDENIENMLKKRGWGGEIIQNEQGDYLAIINSNINGYKTDAVIEEAINLETEIKDDGTIINTLTIKRKHTGGNEEYDWYNRVNADYMRVYVPKGSVLLESSGNTVEEYNPPMDYSNFKIDSEVEAIEKTLKIDPDSGTQIFEEAGKTVFGNWIYVSPQEEATVIYKYELPFKINFKSNQSVVDAYSAIIQKQSGSVGSSFEAQIKFPSSWQKTWQTNNLQSNNNISEKLIHDLIYGTIFLKK